MFCVYERMVNLSILFHMGPEFYVIFRIFPFPRLGFFFSFFFFYVVLSPVTLWFCFSHLKFFFWLCHLTCRVIVPWPGFEPWPKAVKAQSPNHWTAREFPLHLNLCFIKYFGCEREPRQYYDNSISWIIEFSNISIIKFWSFY